MININTATLTSAVAGNGRAVEVLLTELRPVVHRFCAPRVPLRGDIDVEDVVQDVLLAIVRMLPRFEVRGIAQFVAAVLAIARRKTVDTWRKPRRDIPTPITSTPHLPYLLCPGRVVEARLELAEVGEVLGGLPPMQRAVLALRLNGLQSPEIGTVMGRPPSWVRTTQCRAVAAIREQLNPMGVRR